MKIIKFLFDILVLILSCNFLILAILFENFEFRFLLSISFFVLSIGCLLCFVKFLFIDKLFDELAEELKNEINRTDK